MSKQTCPFQKQDWYSDGHPKHDRFCKGEECGMWDHIEYKCCFVVIARSLDKISSRMEELVASK